MKISQERLASKKLKLPHSELRRELMSSFKDLRVAMVLLVAPSLLNSLVMELKERISQVLLMNSMTIFHFKKRLFLVQERLKEQ
jgi:hypothetical protein